MSSLTPAVLCTNDSFGDGTMETWRIALIHDYDTKVWPQQDSAVTGEEMAWNIAGAFDASDIYVTPVLADIALDRWIAERLGEAESYAVFTDEQIYLQVPDDYGDIRLRGLAWASAQAAADPDNESNVAA